MKLSKRLLMHDLIEEIVEALQLASSAGSVDPENLFERNCDKNEPSRPERNSFRVHG